MSRSAADSPTGRDPEERLEIEYRLTDGRIWPLALVAAAWVTTIMILWTEFDVGTSIAVGLAAIVSSVLANRIPSSRIIRITVDSESVERRNMGASFDPGFGRRQNVFLLRRIEPASLAMRYWPFFGLVQIDFRLVGQNKPFTLSVMGRDKGERVYTAIRQRLAAVRGTGAITPR